MNFETGKFHIVRRTISTYSIDVLQAYVISVAITVAVIPRNHVNVYKTQVTVGTNCLTCSRPTIILAVRFDIGATHCYISRECKSPIALWAIEIKRTKTIIVCE